MKKKKNLFAQIMAWLALFAIVIGIVGTGALVLFSEPQVSTDANTQVLTEEDIQRIIDESETQAAAENQDIQLEVETDTQVSTGSVQ